LGVLGGDAAIGEDFTNVPSGDVFSPRIIDDRPDYARVLR